MLVIPMSELKEWMGQVYSWKGPKEADLPQMKQNAADKVHASSLWYRVQMRVGIDISLCGLFCPTENFLRLV